MKRKETIKDKRDFTDIIKNHPYIKNNYFIIYIRNREDNKNYYGIAISTKLGNAVTRNKLKRQIRNIIDDYKNIFPKSKDYIIMIRKACILTKYNILKESLYQLIKEIKWKNK